ncbi:MAG: rod shape-determining protein MreC [Acidimicrobiales bacterium]
MYRRSARPRFVLLLLILTSITLVTLSERGLCSGWIGGLRRGTHDLFAPVQTAADGLLRPVGDLFGGVFHYGSLKSENARLRRELDDARLRSLEFGDAVRERRELLQLNQLPGGLDQLGVRAITARVVATSPSNFQLTVELDRGTAAGVANGMPVVTGAGLVGRVVEVSKRRASVLLASDPTSNDVGAARGSGPSAPLTVDFVDLATKVVRGEVVVTSGLQGSIFPPGIPVGRVRTARVPKGALQQEVTLDPVVDLGHLDFVKVLRWPPAGSSSHEGSQPASPPAPSVPAGSPGASPPVGGAGTPAGTPTSSGGGAQVATAPPPGSPSSTPSGGGQAP